MCLFCQWPTEQRNWAIGWEAKRGGQPLRDENKHENNVDKNTKIIAPNTAGDCRPQREKGGERGWSVSWPISCGVGAALRGLWVVGVGVGLLDVNRAIRDATRSCLNLWPNWLHGSPSSATGGDL